MNETWRFQFEKGEDVCYISHLDLMRCMERSFRRAGIIPAHSEGFNPHPKISFGLPLPVGVVSRICYMDVEFEDAMVGDEMICRLNKALPKGLSISYAVKTEDKKSVMSLVSRAQYRYRIDPLVRDKEELAKEINDILAQTGIYIEKETKKSKKMVNLKDMIHLYHVQTEGDYVVVEVTCDAGSISNLNPMLFWQAICLYSDEVFELVSIERTGLYFAEPNKA